MTLNELSRLYRLNRGIDRDRRRLQMLEQSIPAGSPMIDGLPHAAGSGESKVERIAAEMADLRCVITAKMRQAIFERRILERKIFALPDELTEAIFWYRFIDGMTWEGVADMIGSGYSAERVRQICHRYIDRDGKRTMRQREKGRQRAEQWKSEAAKTK